MMKRVFLASDGETAARVARTCKRLGVATVAMGTDKDLHAEACDDLVASNGEADPAAVVALAKKAGADALHPGYAEPQRHRALAQAASEADIAFVGGAADALAALTDRAGVRSRGERANVRPIPARPAGSRDKAREAARELGYPVVVTAADCGLGHEVLVADDDDELDEATARFRTLAPDQTMLVEPRIEHPRMLEVLVVLDTHQGAAGLAERERSLREGRQVLVEECPSPLFTIRRDGETLRAGMIESAVRVARELAVTDVVSIRYLIDTERRVWFLGAIPGLPRVHTHLEMVTGCDLVELQLRIAAGDKLEDELDLLQLSGHACAADVRAEGEGEVSVESIRVPPASQGRLRVDAAVQVGDTIRATEEPVLLKVTAYAPVRHQAFLSLDRTLAATEVAPLHSNVPRIRRALGHESFRAGQYDTHPLTYE